MKNILKNLDFFLSFKIHVRFLSSQKVELYFNFKIFIDVFAFYPTESAANMFFIYLSGADNIQIFYI